MLSHLMTTPDGENTQQYSTMASMGSQGFSCVANLVYIHYVTYEKSVFSEPVMQKCNHHQMQDACYLFVIHCIHS